MRPSCSPWGPSRSVPTPARRPARPASVVELKPGGGTASPQAARDAARRLPKPVRIIVADGRYELPAALELTAEDSGVAWEAAPGAKPVFSGGRKIAGWKDAGSGLWRSDLPEVREGKWYFEQLWVNGVRATRARSPNTGFFNAVAHASPGVFPRRRTCRTARRGCGNWLITVSSPGLGVRRPCGADGGGTAGRGGVVPAHLVGASLPDPGNEPGGARGAHGRPHGL
ncbi:MAG: hypothetical protein U1G05_05025 [Kiritimatiellia bacterium]